MTAIPSTPSLAQILIRIHRVITRGLYTSLIKGTEYLGQGDPKLEIIQGYARYVHCLTEVLSAHHKGEDLITFPAFMKYLPSAPYAQLSADHHAVEKLLSNLPEATENISNEPSGSGLEVIVANLEKLTAIWEPHILLEEHYFSKEAINAAINKDEQLRIGEASAKHSQEHAAPPYWVVPFILYNLEPKERAIMAANFPPMVINELIPTVWKDEWTPMKPFLLD